ncbi:hypothetical protein BGC_00500 [Burkholderia sp. 3C]
MDGEASEGTYRSLDELFSQEPRHALEHVEFDADAPAVLLMTSGTTGDPKLVAHSQISLTEMGPSRLGLVPERTRVMLAPTPFYHAPGAMLFACAVKAGKTFVFPECRDFQAPAFLDAIERFDCDWLLTSPFGASELVKAQRSRSRSIHSMTSCFVAGDAAPEDLYEHFSDAFGCSLRNYLGMTEGAGFVGPGNQRGTLAINENRAKLMNDAGVEVPRGQVGELCIRAEHMLLGYWEGNQIARDELESGWFRSGDMLWQDENGELHYAFRKKQVIVQDGENISPVEIETALCSHSTIFDAAVVGVPDDKLGQRIIAFVVPADVPSFLPEVVLQDLRLQLAAIKIPEMLIVIGEIPRTAFRKRDRRMLSSMALQQALPEWLS